MKTEDNALVPKVGLVLLVGELVERLLTQPEGGVQAVDLNTEDIVIALSRQLAAWDFWYQVRLPQGHRLNIYVLRSPPQPEGGVQAVDLNTEDYI